ncbi:segregation and condensation protein B [Actinoalloteichus hoggarensis]|uniref:Segregation and condensation protein B n=1 Tax=Actinoalloteichus hoggarensis TaxID=1470176 RepID=A0A221W6A2_9PSEU|nr:SMC-Scp complex subunit ScpB [Actinoalloteichus hoggarensis]ASO21408.1 Segregation and condensation protein B [Actinoalloteichus hoggarensis]MBB5921341.1 segregation and condensation protein B [Actinoalloteichus hoggarensis]
MNAETSDEGRSSLTGRSAGPHGESAPSPAAATNPAEPPRPAPEVPEPPGPVPEVPEPAVPVPDVPQPPVPTPEVPEPPVPAPDVPRPGTPEPEVPDPDVPAPPAEAAAAPPSAPDRAFSRDDAPDLTEDAALDAALEALLLVVDVPAGEELLGGTLDQPAGRISAALRRIALRYDAAESGIELRRIGEGWRLYTRDRYAPYVERYLLDGQRTKLTRAALETLAVIAYRQPTTRSRVAAVRGVNVDGVIRTLLGRGLVEETGTDPETGGLLYRTTELFLERLGLSSLDQLPPIAPLLPEVDSIDEQV